MIRIEGPFGTFLIESWDDVFSVCVQSFDRAELYSTLDFKHRQLIEQNALDGVVWIDDIEDEFDGNVRIIRRWARSDKTVFMESVG